MTSRSFSVQLLSMALVLALAFSMIPLGFTAYADPGTADSSSGKGTLLVIKQATGVESVDDLVSLSLQLQRMALLLLVFAALMGAALRPFPLKVDSCCGQGRALSCPNWSQGSTL